MNDQGNATGQAGATDFQQQNTVNRPLGRVALTVLLGILLSCSSFLRAHEMRALTICQPFAHLIVTGAKRVENRTWPTNVRGPIVIHAGKSREWLELSDDKLTDECYEIPVADMTFGAVVGVADLVACLPKAEIDRGDHDAQFPWLRNHEHTEGPWCFVLENVRRLTPVPFKGSQGFFVVPDGLI